MMASPGGFVIALSVVKLLVGNGQKMEPTLKKDLTLWVSDQEKFQIGQTSSWDQQETFLIFLLNFGLKLAEQVFIWHEHINHWH